MNGAEKARNRRARIVCVQCHNRKLKCDLEKRRIDGSTSCTNCAEGDVACEPRTSGRKARYRLVKTAERNSLTSRSTHPVLLPLPAQQSTSLPDGFQSHSGRVNASQGTPSQILIPCSQHQQLSSVGEQHAMSDVDERERSVTGAAFLGGTILPIFAQEAQAVQVQTVSESSKRQLLSPEFQESCVESYDEFCWPWCPVLDSIHMQRFVETSPKPILLNALGLLGTRIRPPMIEHAGSAEYYRRAKMLFYEDHEPDHIICLQAILLFYWWAPQSPNHVNRDAAYWWTGLAIKYAQQLGLHREPKNIQDIGGDAMQGLRRRIWWTLFARERLTSICQGRPCTIHPEDCNVKETSVDDFPTPLDPRAHVFIQWVKLCAIIGRIGQHLFRASENVFPVSLARELIDWLNSLPVQLKLPIASTTSRPFSRDVHKLHLPYLTTIIVLHLNLSAQNRDRVLPQVHTPALIAASSVARVFKDLLARGQIRFLGAIATWYVGVAIVALLSTQHMPHLRKSGEEDIRLLRVALNELASLWPTASIFVRGFQRLKAFEYLEADTSGLQTTNLAQRQSDVQSSNEQLQETTTECGPQDNSWMYNIDWLSYFPFATSQTSSLIADILSTETPMNEYVVDNDFFWFGDPSLTLQDLFSSANNFDPSALDDTLAF